MLTDSLHGFCPHMVCFTFLRCPQWHNLRKGRRTNKVTTFSNHLYDSQLYVIADWSCIQRVFETPQGVLMGQMFLRRAGLWKPDGGRARDSEAFKLMVSV
jgi:hypothetical protein